MSIHRYLKDIDGLRQYVIFLEQMPPTKREKFLTNGRKENKKFVDHAEQFILTFDKLAQLPEMELTELVGALKPKIIAHAMKSLDETKKKRLQKLTPTNMRIEIQSYEEDNPTIPEQNMARFAFIKMARELETKGLLRSITIPPLTAGEF